MANTKDNRIGASYRGPAKVYVTNASGAIIISVHTQDIFTGEYHIGYAQLEGVKCSYEQSQERMQKTKPNTAFHGMISMWRVEGLPLPMATFTYESENSTYDLAEDMISDGYASTAPSLTRLG